MKKRLVWIFAIILTTYATGLTQSIKNTDAISNSILESEPANITLGNEIINQDFNVTLQDNNGKDQLLLTTSGANGW